MFEKSSSGKLHTRVLSQIHRMLRNFFIDSQWARQAGFLIGDVYDEF